MNFNLFLPGDEAVFGDFEGVAIGEKIEGVVGDGGEAVV